MNVFAYEERKREYVGEKKEVRNLMMMNMICMSVTNMKDDVTTFL